MRQTCVVDAEEESCQRCARTQVTEVTYFYEADQFLVGGTATHAGNTLTQWVSVTARAIASNQIRVEDQDTQTSRARLLCGEFSRGRPPLASREVF